MAKSVGSSWEMVPAGKAASDAEKGNEAPAAGSSAPAAANGGKDAEETSACGGAAIGDRAPAAASSTSAAADGEKGGDETAASDVAKGLGIAATGSSASAAAYGEKVCEETGGSGARKGGDAPAAGSSSPPAANGEKKKRTVRMSQAQVDHILAYTPTRLPTLPNLMNLPEHLKAMVTDAIDNATRFLRESHEFRLREQERVRKQLEEKGYAEYEVDDDEAEAAWGGEEMVLARCGRRRYRPGIKKTAGGSVKRVN